MAILTLLIPLDPNWVPGDRLTLMVGSENAASLAASTPSGGTAVRSVDPTEGRYSAGFGVGGFGLAPFGFDDGGEGFGRAEFGFGAFGLGDRSRVRLEHRLVPEDVSGVAPIGAIITDAAGNAAAVAETVAPIDDAPDGPRNIAAAATANSWEVRLSWTESPQV